MMVLFFFFFQAEDGIRILTVTGVQTCALPISHEPCPPGHPASQDRDVQVAGMVRGDQHPAGLWHVVRAGDPEPEQHRSEEHTSELQSQSNLVCRLLLEKKKKY